MTAPGDFSSGDVLTAAEMNDLPAGELARATATGDITVTSSDTDIRNITFTVPSSRRVTIVCTCGIYDNFSGTPINVRNLLQDTNAAGTPSEYYGEAYAVLAASQGALTMSVTQNFTAGTYTIYWVAYTNAGSCRMNGNASTKRNHQMIAYDMGAV